MTVQLVPIHEFNGCHNPEGEGGGQFCSSGKVTDTMPGVRAKSKKDLEAMVTSYGLTLKKAKRDDDGSWIVTVEGGRPELEHFNRDTEG